MAKSKQPMICIPALRTHTEVAVLAHATEMEWEADGRPQKPWPGDPAPHREMVEGGRRCP